MLWDCNGNPLVAVCVSAQGNYSWLVKELYVDKDQALVLSLEAFSGFLQGSNSAHQCCMYEIHFQTVLRCVMRKNL